MDVSGLPKRARARHQAPPTTFILQLCTAKMLLEFCRRAASCRIITVEPVLYLYFFARYLYYPLIQQYIFWRYGNDRLQNTSFPFPNGSFCITKKELDGYGANGTGDDVEESANFLVLYGQIANTLPSILAAIGFGSFSDYFGRRPAMIIVSLGAALQGLGIIAIIQFQLNMYFYLLTNVISGVTGGMATMLTLGFSYIADVTTIQQRTWRIGIAESMMFIGEAVAQGAGGYWLQQLNCYFERPMWVYVGCQMLIVAYVLLLLPESMSRAERLEKTNKRSSSFQAVIQGIRIFLGCDVQGYSIWRLWAALLSMCIVILNRVGSRQITTFFLLTDPLNWDPTKIGIYGLLNRLCQGISLIFILPVLVLIGFSDTVIAFIGLTFSCGTSIFTGFITRTWEMFLGEFIQYVVIAIN